MRVVVTLKAICQCGDGITDRIVEDEEDRIAKDGDCGILEDVEIE